MKLYVRLNGCDASTPIIVDANPDQVAFLKLLALKFREASRYDCMPILSVLTKRPSNYETDEEFLESE